MNTSPLRTSQPSHRGRPLATRLSGTDGAVLPIVLLFALVAGIMVSVYLRSQYAFHRPYFRDFVTLQALLNARSGVYRGLEILNAQDTTLNNSSAADSTMDDMFGADLFEEALPDSDTSIVLELDTELPLTLYSDNAHGDCLLTLKQVGFFQRLHAVGRFRHEQREIAATLGAQPFTTADTVLYLETGSDPDGTGLIDGDIAFLTDKLDTAGAIGRRFQVQKTLGSYIDSIDTRLADATLDTAEEAVPLSVEYSDECPDIPDVVMGPLILDGTFHPLVWKENRTILILGDLQINGEVHIEGLTFLVGGEIRLGVTEDPTQRDLVLKSVSLFSRRRIFFAHNVIFSGSALALEDLEIYENARIADRSIIISNAGRKRSSSAHLPVTVNATSTTKDENPSGKMILKKSAKKKKTNPFSIRVRDEAVVDGILINTTKRGGIYTAPETSLRGVLWGEGFVCHQGKMEGVILAHALVDSSNIVAGHNTMNGSIEPLPSIAEYHLPWFVSILTVLEWEEN